MKRFSSLFAVASTVLMIHSLVLAQDTTLTITSGGKVGIGTTNPVYPLHLVSPLVDVMRLESSNSIATRLWLGNATIANPYALVATGIGSNIGGGRFFIGQAYGSSLLPRLAVDSSGNVGIGTTNPGSKLQVSGSVGVGDLPRFGNHMLSSRVDSANSGIDVAVFGANYRSSGFSVGVLGQSSAPSGFGVYSNGNFQVENGNATFLGNVGIGTTTPAGLAHLYNTNASSTSSQLIIEANSSFGPQTFSGIEFRANAASTGVGPSGRIVTYCPTPTYTDATMMFQTIGAGPSFVNTMSLKGGKVGIGTTLADQLLSVNGNASKVGGGSWATFSDRRLKKDIKSFSDGLSVLEKIRPVTFRYNGKLGYPTDKTYVGVIAQEIRPVAPYTVDTYRAKLNPQDKKKTDILRYDSSALIYIAINAIKELDAKVEEMKRVQDENRALAVRLAQLETLVKSLASERNATNGKSLSELR